MKEKEYLQHCMVSCITSRVFLIGYFKAGPVITIHEDKILDGLASVKVMVKVS